MNKVTLHNSSGWRSLVYNKNDVCLADVTETANSVDFGINFCFHLKLAIILYLKFKVTLDECGLGSLCKINLSLVFINQLFDFHFFE